jgi:NADP-dependent 3-hydroxy acid dehydrogenase YdfG
MNASLDSRTRYRIMVTGASAGIGRAIVQVLAARGHQLHAVARSGERLAVLAQETGCTFDSVDIRDTARMREIIDRVKPSVLVNDAGTSAAFQMLDATPEAITETIEINLTATLRVTHFALKHMLAVSRGHIVTMGSISGLHPTVSTVYAASKSALHRASECLRLELAGSGIRVTEICPGLVDTNLAPDVLRKMTHGAKLLSPEDVADAVRYAIEAPEHVNISTLELLPVEQAVGGVIFKNVADDRFA